MPRSPTTFPIRLLEGWLPLPDELVQTLGWKEGDMLECVPINMGEQLIVRKPTVSTQNATDPGEAS